MKTQQHVPADGKRSMNKLPDKSRLPVKPITQKSARKAIRHKPRLETLLMVEKTIRNKQVFNSKSQLWRSLPKAMQYGTLLEALKYLEDSNKIIIDKDGTIIWTFVDSAAARRSLEESTPL